MNVANAYHKKQVNVKTQPNESFNTTLSITTNRDKEVPCSWGCGQAHGTTSSCPVLSVGKGFSGVSRNDDKFLS
jgi:hypothetical protein